MSLLPKVVIFLQDQGMNPHVASSCLVKCQVGHTLKRGGGGGGGLTGVAECRVMAAVGMGASPHAAVLS